MLIVSDGPYFGMNFAVAPDERMDDGLLTVSVFSRYSKLQLWWHFASLAFGRREFCPRSIAFRVASLKVGGPRSCRSSSTARRSTTLSRSLSSARRAPHGLPPGEELSGTVGALTEVPSSGWQALDLGCSGLMPRACSEASGEPAASLLDELAALAAKGHAHSPRRFGHSLRMAADGNVNATAFAQSRGRD